jgi:hypothetical protein
VFYFYGADDAIINDITLLQGLIGPNFNFIMASLKDHLQINILANSILQLLVQHLHCVCFSIQATKVENLTTVIHLHLNLRLIVVNGLGRK